jgi:hypothetical protein
VSHAAAALNPIRGALLLKLDPQALFQCADAVSRHGELGMLRVFEGEDDLTGEPGVHLVNPVDIDER